MAGGNTVADHAALRLTLQIWESLINEKYMKEARHYDGPMCPTCNSPRDCNNYYCLQCKTGGLCPSVLRTVHHNHPYMQVRYYSRQYSVFKKDLELFINEEGLNHIQANKLNAGDRHCNLRSKAVAAASSSTSRPRGSSRAGDKSCQGCMASLRGSKGSKETFLVCSLECLMKAAHEKSELGLLAMKDGAMVQHMKIPLSYREKIRPRMLETTDDDDTLVTSILEALPFPLATKDYPMFGTPAETFVGEPLPFPPVNEEFPMPFEKPVVVAPAETAPGQLETFSLPLEFQAFDISPEWEAEDWMWI